MTKTIYSAKPHKDGYKITRYLWQDNHYKDIKGIVILADKESAKNHLLGMQHIAKIDGYKTTFEETQKWIFLTIEGDY